MKVRIKVRPTGYISLGGGPLQAWPKVGAIVDLPDAVAQGLLASGDAEPVRLAKVTERLATAVETRPAPVADMEERTPALARRRRTRHTSAAPEQGDES